MPSEIAFSQGSTFNTKVSEVVFDRGDTISVRRRNNVGPTTTPHWTDDPDLWDTVVIDGAPLPGMCSLSGDGYKWRVDRQKSPGQNGQKLRVLGRDPAVFSVTLKLWKPEHLTTWASLIPRLRPHTRVVTVRRTSTAPAVSEKVDLNGRFQSSGPKATALVDEKQTKPPAAVDIYHPAIALYGITKVFVLSASLPEPAEKDIYQVKLECEEHFTGNRTVGVSTPKASTDITGLGPGRVARAVAAGNTLPSSALPSATQTQP